MGTMGFTRATRRPALVALLGALATACDGGGGATVEPPSVDHRPSTLPIDAPPRSAAPTTTRQEPARADSPVASAEAPPAADDPSAPAAPTGPAVPTSAPELRLLVSKLRPSSAVSPGQLQQSVLRRRTVLLACYSAALTRDPRLRGDVDVQVRAEHTGQSRSTSVSSPNLADEDFLACVRSALSAHRYPAARDAGPGLVAFRLTFEAAPR